MKKAFVLAVSFFAMVCILSSCKKDDKTSNLKGRDAIVGSYNFTNTYTLYTNRGNGQIDTTRNTKTFVITIDKPDPDNVGTNVLLIRNMMNNYPTDVVGINVSTDGTVLSAEASDMINDVEFDSFQGLVNGNTITFNYRTTGYVINEEGNGTATKR